MNRITFTFEEMEREIRKRDEEWTRVLAGKGADVMTPAEAAKWLEQDRIQRARNVSEARVRRGPVRW